ncbi:MAG: hypothetical protein FWE42_04390 [Defluviitaleaceae bacterium]|nr:hypothetical protein [Defluviitaleaceae bacterium]
MNEAEQRSNLLGLVILFVVFTPLGVLLSFFYVIFQTRVYDVWANVIAAFVMGAALAIVAWLIKRFTKITNNAMSLVLIAIGMAIVLYAMWYMWFAAMFMYLDYTEGFLAAPWGITNIGAAFSETRAMMSHGPGFMYLLRGFNQNVLFTINDTELNPLVVAAIWAGEALIIVLIPLMAAYSSAGLFITELNAWVEERLMNYGFTAFDDYELDRIAAGEIEAIIEKPLEARNGAMSAIAVCYHKDEPTDFIAIYKANWDKEGVLNKGRHLMTVRLGAEKIDALDAGLQAKHYPAATRKEEKPAENFETSDAVNEAGLPITEPPPYVIEEPPIETESNTESNSDAE